jgi:dihydropyrimidinase
MKYDTIIRGGQLVIPKVGITSGDLAIRDGKIAAIVHSGDTANSSEIIDATNRFIMPGLIDPHVHFGLGDPSVEFKSETESAAFGGMTTLIFYIMGSQDYGTTHNELKKSGEQETYVDFGIHYTIAVEEQMASIDKYITQFGVPSFKLMMHFRGDEGRYMNVSGIDDGFIYAFFESLSKFDNGIACVHPENIEIISRMRNQLIEQGREDVLAWTECRPAFVEAESIYRAAYLAHITGCTLYIVHITSREALEAALDCRNRYRNSIFFETCPHYLTHTADTVGSVFGKVNPPLRFQDDIDSLWEAIADGSIDTVGSDHVPRRSDRKRGTVWQASAGFPGVETLLSVLLSEGVNKRGISLQRVAELTSYNPARIFNIYPRKGTLMPGSDADITLVDLEIEKQVKASELHGYSDYSLYEDWKFKGWPVLTMVRGKIVVGEGKTLGSQGYGKYLER